MVPGSDTAPTGRPGPSSAGAILGLIRAGEARTRNDIQELTGLSRSTVIQRVGVLLASGLVHEVRGIRSNGGRPPTRLAFRDAAGVVLAADLGATHRRVAVTDLGGTVLAEHQARQPIAEGPDSVLGAVRADFAAVLEAAGLDGGAVLGAGIGVPGPVDYASGRPTNPPIMPGWDGFPIRDALAETYDVPVLVDNDVNVMALGEHRAHLRDLDHLLFVKVATGIGAGIIANGEIYRGAHAAAGDIGHTRSTGGSDVLCTCGNRGCIGALASGSAIARQLAAAGIPATSSADVVRLVHERRPEAVQHVRDAGRLLGDVLAGAITLLAPSAIVIGGEMAEVHEPLLAGIRSRIYERALPLATRDLRIVPSRLGARAGIAGAATLAIEHLLAPENVDGLIVRRTAAAPAVARRSAAAKR